MRDNPSLPVLAGDSDLNSTILKCIISSTNVTIFDLNCASPGHNFGTRVDRFAQSGEKLGMRWLSFRCAFVILVLSLSLAPQARANPVCGDGANLGDLSLQTLVDTISEGLAQSELPPDGLKIALGVDVERLEKVRGDTSAEDLRNRIFYTACRVRLEKLKEQGSPLHLRRDLGSGGLQFNAP